MMALRIYWRAARTRRCIAELAIAASLVAPLSVLAKDARPADAERVTAREAIERQFAAPPTREPALSAPEAAAIMKRYHARIGVMLEPKREIGGDRAER